MLAKHQTLTSNDGTTLDYQTMGSGPGVILIPGALSVADNYLQFAQTLAAQFTVHTLERRGRGLSGPQGEDYGVGKEIADIQTIQAETGAVYLFGHSFGGFAALEAARNNKTLRAVAVYEPGVSVDGSINIRWIPPAAEQLRANKFADAFATFVRGTNPQSARLPHWVLKHILPFAIKREVREQYYRLLETAIHEHAEEARLNNTYPHYQEIQAPVLLMQAGKGVLPDNTVAKLMPVLPEGSQLAVFPDFDHFGPENKVKEVAQKVAAFFEAS